MLSGLARLNVKYIDRNSLHVFHSHSSLSISERLFDQLTNSHSAVRERECVTDAMLDVACSDEVVSRDNVVFVWVNNIRQVFIRDDTLPGVFVHPAFLSVGSVDHIVVAFREHAEHDVADVASGEHEHEVERASEHFPYFLHHLVSVLQKSFRIFRMVSEEFHDASVLEVKRHIWVNLVFDDGVVDAAEGVNHILFVE